MPGQNRIQDRSIVLSYLSQAVFTVFALYRSAVSSGLKCDDEVTGRGYIDQQTLTFGLVSTTPDRNGQEVSLYGVNGLELNLDTGNVRLYCTDQRQGLLVVLIPAQYMSPDIPRLLEEARQAANPRRP